MSDTAGLRRRSHRWWYCCGVLQGLHPAIERVGVPGFGLPQAVGHLQEPPFGVISVPGGPSFRVGDQGQTVMIVILVFGGMAQGVGKGQPVAGQIVGIGFRLHGRAVSGDPGQIPFRVVHIVGGVAEGNRRRASGQPPVVVVNKGGGMAQRIGQAGQVAGGIVPETRGQVQTAGAHHHGFQLAIGIIGVMGHPAVGQGLVFHLALGVVGEAGGGSAAGNRRGHNGFEIAVAGIVIKRGYPGQRIRDGGHFIEIRFIGEGGDQRRAAALGIHADGEDVVLVVVGVPDRVAFGIHGFGQAVPAVVFHGHGPAQAVDFFNRVVFMVEVPGTGMPVRTDFLATDAAEKVLGSGPADHGLGYGPVQVDYSFFKELFPDWIGSFTMPIVFS